MTNPNEKSREEKMKEVIDGAKRVDGEEMNLEDKLKIAKHAPDVLDWAEKTMKEIRKDPKPEKLEDYEVTSCVLDCSWGPAEGGSLSKGGLKIQWGVKGVGFGELDIWITSEGKLRADSETMGRDFAKLIMCALMDRVEFISPKLEAITKEEHGMDSHADMDEEDDEKGSE